MLIRIQTNIARRTPHLYTRPLATAIPCRRNLNIIIPKRRAHQPGALAIQIRQVPVDARVGGIRVFELEDAGAEVRVVLGDLDGRAAVADPIEAEDAAGGDGPGGGARGALAFVVGAHVAAAAGGAVDLHGHVAIVVDVEGGGGGCGEQAEDGGEGGGEHFEGGGGLILGVKECGTCKNVG